MAVRASELVGRCPLVGNDTDGVSLILERDTALGAIGRLVNGVVDGQGHALFFVAGAGLGKTTLLRRAVTTAAERGCVVRTAQGAAPEALLAFGLIEQALGEDTAAALHAGNSRARLYTALRRIRELASAQPALLALDDLHWSDPDSLALLHFLARRIRGLPVGVIGTLRPWPALASETVDSLAAGGCATLEMLAPLSVSAVDRILVAVRGRSPGTAMVRRVHAACGGNPLLVRHLVTSEPRRPDPTMTISPCTHSRWLLTRFAGVDSEALGLLRAACVMGARFRPDAAASVAGVRDDGARVLAGLERAGLVRDTDDGCYEFAHDLFREALYDDMTSAERIRLHTATLRALAAHPAATAAEAARHAEAARLVGDGQAIALLRQAGYEAEAAGAVHAARVHLAAAADLAGDGAPADLLVSLARATLVSGDIPGAKAVARRACADGHAAAATRVAALGCLGDAHFAGGELTDAARCYDAAEEGALHVSPELAAIMLLARAFSSWLVVGPEDARQRACRARALVGDGHPMLRDIADIAGGVLGYLAADAAGLAQAAAAHHRLFATPDGANTMIPVCVGGARVTPVTVGAAGWYCVAAKYAERFAEAERDLTRLIGLADSVGEPTALSQARWHYADLLWRRGRLSEAAEQIHHAEDLDELVPVARPFTAALDALVLADLGRLADADRLCDTAEPTSGVCSEIWLGLARGTLLLRQAHPEAAHEELAAVGELARQTGRIEPCAIPWAAEAIRAAAAVDALDEVAAITAWLEQFPGELPCDWPRGVLASGRAVLFERRGQPAEAERSHVEAVRLMQRCGLPLAHIAALIEQGAFLRRGGRRHEARRPLAVALGLARANPAGWHVQWASRELAQAGGRPSRRDGLLTVQEHTVARLAADGLSNPEISRSLHISVKTVETHLGHVYAKLDIHTRRQLRDRTWSPD